MTHVGGASSTTGTDAIAPTAVAIAFSRKDEDRLGNPVRFGPAQCHADRSGAAQRHAHHSSDRTGKPDRHPLTLDNSGRFESTSEDETIKQA